MSTEYAVELAKVDKVFHTHHFFQKNDDTGRRSFYHRKRIHAVQAVEFGIRPGEVLGLLGPNGAGKTTCVKMISSLVRPTAGKVFVNGMHVEKRRHEVLRHVGVVLEGTRTVIWPLTPLENLMYFGRLRDVSSKDLKKRARDLLDFIGLRDKMDTQVRRLSRGQRQRLAICIAMVSDPKVLLLDEPTTGLDVQSSRAIRTKVVELTREFNKSVLLTTHDMHIAQLLCDRIGIIDKGRLITCRKTRDLISVFADQTYEFRLDRMPPVELITSIPGVHEARVEADGAEEPVLLVRVSEDETERSRALYEVMDALRREQHLVRAVSLREQTLEEAFLRLTESTI